MLPDSAELQKPGVDFHDMITCACQYLAENKIWHKLKRSSPDTYFHPVMLQLKENLSSTIFSSSNENLFILARRLKPTSFRSIIPHYIFTNLQVQLYEILLNNNNNNNKNPQKHKEMAWEYKFTPNVITFITRNLNFIPVHGFRILTPESKTSNNQPSDYTQSTPLLDEHSFLEIHVISENVSTACCIYSSILTLLFELTEKESNIKWTEYCIDDLSSIKKKSESYLFSDQIYPLKSIVKKEFFSTFDHHSDDEFEFNKQKTLSSSSLNLFYKNAHYLIPDILQIETKNCKISYEMDKKRRELIISIQLFTIWNKSRNINPYDDVNVYLYDLNKKEGKYVPKSLDDDDDSDSDDHHKQNQQYNLDGYYYYKAYPSHTNYILFCCLKNEKNPISGYPIHLNHFDKSDKKKYTISYDEIKEQHSNINYIQEKDEKFDYKTIFSRLFNDIDLHNEKFQFQKNKLSSELITSTIRPNTLQKYIQFDSNCSNEKIIKSHRLQELSSKIIKKAPFYICYDDLFISKLLFKFKCFPSLVKNPKKIKDKVKQHIEIEIQPTKPYLDDVINLQRVIDRYSFKYESKPVNITNFKVKPEVFTPDFFLFPFKQSSLNFFTFFERNDEIYICIRNIISESKFHAEVNEILSFSSNSDCNSSEFFDSIQKYAENTIFQEFYAIYKNFFIKEEISKNSSIHIVGHSIGGAVAIVLSRIFLEHDWKKSIFTVTFGCPVFADEKYYSWDGWKSPNLFLYNFASQQDPVVSFFLRNNDNLFFIGNLFIFDRYTKEFKFISSPIDYLKNQIVNEINVASHLVFNRISYYQECFGTLMSRIEQSVDEFKHDLLIPSEKAEQLPAVKSQVRRLKRTLL